MVTQALGMLNCCSYSVGGSLLPPAGEAWGPFDVCDRNPHPEQSQPLSPPLCLPEAARLHCPLTGREKQGDLCIC